MRSFAHDLLASRNRLALSSEANLGRILSAIEDDKLRFEEDVAIDGKANTLVGLDSTIAC